MFNLLKKDVNNKVSELENIIKKIKLDTKNFEKIPEKYKTNKNVISTLLKKDDFKYKNLSVKDRNNKVLFQKILLRKKDGNILRYAGENINTDFNSILIAVYFTPCSIDYVTKINNNSKQEIEELLFWIISSDDKLINFINKDILSGINITKEELKKLNLNSHKIKEKYEMKLGLNKEDNTKDNINKRKFNLNTLFKN